MHILLLVCCRSYRACSPSQDTGRKQPSEPMFWNKGNENSVFAVISVLALISAHPHISQLIQLIFLNMSVFKSSLYHVSLLRYWHFKFSSLNYSLKLQTSISPQLQMIEIWFKNWPADYEKSKCYQSESFFKCQA